MAFMAYQVRVAESVKFAVKRDEERIFFLLDIYAFYITAYILKFLAHRALFFG